MAIDGVMPQTKTREEFGHEYAWHKELEFWYPTRVGRGRNPVQIFPPSNARTDWWLVVPRHNSFHRVIGEDAEKRCFSLAAGYIVVN